MNDSQGAAVVEFALIAPIFMLLITAIIEFSLVMFASSVMEGATATSARYGKTGYVASGSTRQEQIANVIAARSAGLLNAANIVVVTKVYPSFGSISQEEPYIDSNRNGTWNTGEEYTDVNFNGQWDSQGVAGLGNANDVVLYTILYPWQINTPIISYFMGETLWLSSKTVVKNEPY